jgi:flagellar biosynthetic protein FliO
MKAILLPLVILALFLPCVFAQAVSTPAPDTASGSMGSGSGPSAEPAPAAPSAQVQDGGMSFPIFRAVGGMGVVLGLMAGIYFAVKKFAPRYFPKAAAEKNLKVIETLSMGDRRSISLIEVGSSRFLVGNTPQNINLLAALPEPISFVSEPEGVPANTKEKERRELTSPFRNLFEAEKQGRPRYMANALPDDIRAKMRQLRESLER